MFPRSVNAAPRVRADPGELVRRREGPARLPRARRLLQVSLVERAPYMFSELFC